MVCSLLLLLVLAELLEDLVDDMHMITIRTDPDWAVVMADLPRRQHPKHCRLVARYEGQDAYWRVGAEPIVSPILPPGMEPISCSLLLVL